MGRVEGHGGPSQRSAGLDGGRGGRGGRPEATKGRCDRSLRGQGRIHLGCSRCFCGRTTCGIMPLTAHAGMRSRYHRPSRDPCEAGRRLGERLMSLTRRRITGSRRPSRRERTLTPGGSRDTALCASGEVCSGAPRRPSRGQRWIRSEGGLGRRAGLHQLSAFCLCGGGQVRSARSRWR